jgi:hypothetical protein
LGGGSSRNAEGPAARPVNAAADISQAIRIANGATPSRHWSAFLMSLLNNVELVMYTPMQDATPPTVAHMRDALAHHGFKRERADDVPDSTAFRRAVKNKEDKEHKATVWQNGKLRGQLDRLEPQDDGTIRRVWIGKWSMDENGFVDGGLEVAPFRERYVWADISGIIQEILKRDGLGAYTPRRAGGIYFVPVSNADLLDRLEQCCSSIGLSLLRYQVPDTSAQRSEVADAIATSLLADCDAHAEAIAGYSPETTKGGIVANRLEAVSQTGALANRLTPHLGDRAAPIFERIVALVAQANAVAAAIQAYRPVSGGRRIVTAELSHA